MQGRSVLLRPVTEADYPTIYSWRVDAGFVALWHTTSRRIPTYREWLPELERWLSDGITLLVAGRGAARRQASGERSGAAAGDPGTAAGQMSDANEEDRLRS